MTLVFKYCITKFVYVSQATTSLEFPQNKRNIFKLLKIFFSMFLRNNEITTTFSILKRKKEKLKMLVWFIPPSINLYIKVTEDY